MITTVVIVAIAIGTIFGFLLGWIARADVDAGVFDRTLTADDLPAATAREIRRAHRRQRADLRRALGRGASR